MHYIISNINNAKIDKFAARLEDYQPSDTVTKCIYRLLYKREDYQLIDTVTKCIYSYSSK